MEIIKAVITQISGAVVEKVSLFNGSCGLPSPSSLPSVYQKIQFCTDKKLKVKFNSLVILSLSMCSKNKRAYVKLKHHPYTANHFQVCKRFQAITCKSLLCAPIVLSI